MRWPAAIVVVLFACGTKSGGGTPGDGTSIDMPGGANACYLPGNSGTGSADDTDCCFGLQCKTGHCCRAGGAVCNGDGDCCSGTCSGGTCACSITQCIRELDCCAGTTCVGGVCLRRGGAICNLSPQCASGTCSANGLCAGSAEGQSCTATLACNNGLQCRGGACCRQGGAQCTSGTQCCSGSCDGGQCACTR
jgi:hypothetical protein